MGPAGGDGGADQLAVHPAAQAVQAGSTGGRPGTAGRRLGPLAAEPSKARLKKVPRHPLCCPLCCLLCCRLLRCPPCAPPARSLVDRQRVEEDEVELGDTGVTQAAAHAHVGLQQRVVGGGGEGQHGEHWWAPGCRLQRQLTACRQASRWPSRKPNHPPINNLRLPPLPPGPARPTCRMFCTLRMTSACFSTSTFCLACSMICCQVALGGPISRCRYSSRRLGSAGAGRGVAGGQKGPRHTEHFEYFNFHWGHRNMFIHIHYCT